MTGLGFTSSHNLTEEAWPDRGDRGA